MFIPHNNQVRKATLLEENYFKVIFSYNPDLVTGIKSLVRPKDCWNPILKYWKVNANQFNLNKLRSWNFEIDSSIDRWEKKHTMGISQSNSDKPPAKIQELKKRLNVKLDLLRDYQLEGIDFVEYTRGRCLIADQMGLGKTIQVISWLSIYEKELKNQNALIVCPASIKINWQREIEKWSNIPTCILQGTKAKDKIPNHGIIIINYDILSDWISVLEKHELFVIICDEIHYCKSTKTQRTKAVQYLANKTKRFIALSGTPITNRPIEFFPTLKIIDPLHFSSMWKFAQKYCNAKHNGFGWDFSGSSNTEELHEIIHNRIMIRRLKKDVLKELPPKQVTILPIDMDQNTWAEYQHAEYNFEEYYGSYTSAEAMVKIEIIKQIAWEGKRKQIFEWIENFLEEDEKLVIFCTHKKAIEEIMAEFPKISVKLDGSCSGTEKQKAVDRFQTDNKTRLFVANIKAGGIGINLTASSTVLFVELGWTPGDHEQAADRCHRLGQTADHINIYYAIAQNTIEEDILAIIDRKQKVLNSVLDGQITPEEHMLSELIKRIKSRKDYL